MRQNCNDNKPNMWLKSINNDSNCKIFMDILIGLLISMNICESTHITPICYRPTHKFRLHDNLLTKLSITNGELAMTKYGQHQHVPIYFLE